MLIKILSSASRNFEGVRYNDKKINSGDGELLKLENFPSFIKGSNQETVRNYLKNVSDNKKIKKPQFHAVISTKYQEHTKEELSEVATEVMNEMGYGKQPYLIVFHNDTDNNHVHIVSSRVNKDTGKKIDDSFEHIKSQRALKNVLERMYGIKTEMDLKLLLEYRISSVKQLETLLSREGLKLVKIDETKLDVLKNGVKEKTLSPSDLRFENENTQRKRQLRAIFNKYKGHYSNQVFRVIDDRERNGRTNEEKNEKAEVKIEFESELQHNFRKLFGVDIVFHNKDDKDPFGYTVIDHKTGSVFKGSEIMKMKELFVFSSAELDKKNFEKLKNYNVNNDTEKRCLMNYLRIENKNIEEFMIFKNRNKTKLDDYKSLKADVISFVKERQHNDNVHIIKSEDGDFYAIHSKYNHIQELESLIGNDLFEEFLNPELIENREFEKTEQTKSNGSGFEEVLREWAKSEFTKTDPTEKELKKKRKKRRR